MLNELCDEIPDRSIELLKRAKDASSILKLELINYRSNNPNAIVFAFEGIDDKIVYSHWIRQFSPNFNYEPFPCQNKHGVLKLKASLERDLNGLGEGVYFFIDRDFDDLMGHSATESIFMTEKYSIENYLVNTDVLDQLLKNEFHCHARPQLRAEVLQLFRSQYNRFLESTADINLRIFLGKKCSISRDGDIKSKINSIAKVSLNNIEASDVSAVDVVCLNREPTKDEVEKYRDEFRALDPIDRYRGKFALVFFRKWLELLAQDRNSNASLLFPDLDRENFKAPGHITLDSLASKASPPSGFMDFLTKIFKSPSFINN